MLMHEYKNPDTVVNAQYVHVRSQAKLSAATLKYVTFKQWTAETRQRTKSHIQSYNMFTVLKYPIKYSV